MGSFTVYTACSPSGKWYIGITSQSLNKRIQDHYAAAKRGSPYKFHKALRKYGEEMKWSQACTTHFFETTQFSEKELIRLFDSYKKGYNSTRGGEGQLGRTLSKQQQLDLTKAHGAKPFKVFEKKTGKYMGTWINRSQCARDLNCHDTHICKALKGELKSHKGFIFVLEEENASGKS